MPEVETDLYGAQITEILKATQADAHNCLRHLKGLIMASSLTVESHPSDNKKATNKCLLVAFLFMAIEAPIIFSSREPSSDHRIH